MDDQRVVPSSSGAPAGSGGVAPNGSAAARDIRAIHTLKTRLKWSDDDYRALLRTLTGKTSSKDCTPAERRHVREHLQGLAARAGVARPQVRTPLSPRERKVWALWQRAHRDGLVQSTHPRALDAWVRRQVGVDALRFCTPAQLDTLIESLKKWVERGEVLGE